MKVIRNIFNKPLIVHTGKFTGRSPNDRYFVDQAEVHDKIFWGNHNRKISIKHYLLLYQEIKTYLNKRKTFNFEGNVCADKEYSYSISLETEIKWYVQFASNMF